MNALHTDKQAAIVRALVDGCSIRATVRMTGVGKNTIARLLPKLGSACLKLHDERVRNLDCQRIHASRSRAACYRHELNGDDHAELLDALCACKGRVVLSGYFCPLYRRVLRRWKLYKRVVPCLAERRTNGAARGKRTECLWIKRA